MKINKFFLLIPMSAILFNCHAQKNSPGFYNGYETAKYKVLKQDNNIEIRKYDAMLVAEVEVAANKREDAAGQGFRILAGYIFGKNNPEQKIAMTTPVSQNPVLKPQKIAMTTPVLQSAETGKWKIQFMMPRKYNLESLPQAQDQRIKFKTMPSKTVIAIIFKGRWSEKNLSKNLQELENYIAKENLKVQRPQNYAFYNDPFTLPFNRRNEIMFTIIGK